MKRRVARFVICILLMTALSSSVIQAQQPCLAAAVYSHYYIIINNSTSYALSSQQYETLAQGWDSYSSEELVALLKSFLGENFYSGTINQINLRASTQAQSSGTSASANNGEANSQSTSDNSYKNGFLISGGVLKRYDGTQAVVTIPDSVTKISSGAFNQNSYVKKIIVPASVKSIAQLAFYKCFSLRYIVFLGKCTTIAEDIIYKCDNLTNIVAPSDSKEHQYALTEDIPVFTSDQPALISKSICLLKGDTQKLVVYNTIDSVKWSSSKKSVVSVSSDGMIKCRKKGTAKITAKVNGKSYSIKVKVSEKTQEKRVKQIIKAVVKKNMSTKEKIKAVHNWLIKNVQYDYANYQRGTIPVVSHTAYGALIGGVAVCDGYAKAFKKVMDKLRIPCRLKTGFGSSGGSHAWNVVKVGGKWLHVDVTYDDPIINGSATNTKPFYTYFLKTSKQMKKTHSW